MTMPVQQQATTADTAVTRSDVVRLLEEGGSPERLDVSGQNLQGINLVNCNLSGSNLRQTRICEANLCGANLSGADLREADLHGTYLCWADLRDANLSGADLREAQLIWADLPGASLDEADLRGADFSWTSLGGANAFAPTRSQLRRRGAIFRETTREIVAERFSDKAARSALGFALSLPFMSLVGFVMGLGIRVILAHLRQTARPAKH